MTPNVHQSGIHLLTKLLQGNSSLYFSEMEIWNAQYNNIQPRIK